MQGKKSEIILAKTAGFCFGVTRAVDKVHEIAAATTDDVYTFGPIIHNDEVVSDLEKMGAFATSPDKISSLKEGATVIIRSHGITAEEEKTLVNSGFDVVDATCPFVKKIHKIVEEVEDETVIIIGDPEHPEVQGIRSRAPKNTYVICSEEEAENLPKLDKVIVVSQTTFNYEKFQKIVDNIKQKCYYCSVMNTICNATQERQEEAKEIAKSVDAMFVIGGRNSSNTQKLFDICRAECQNTYFVQTVSDCEKISFPHVQRVGITAGASTPGNIIQEVLSYVRTKL